MEQREETEKPVRRRASPLWLAGIIGLTALVYLFSPVRITMDSHYTLLLSERIWRHGSFALDPHFAHPERHWPGAPVDATNLPYQVYRHDGHVRYFYPPGASVLSVPFVAALNLAGISSTDTRRGYAQDREERMQGMIAGLVTALTAGLLFLLAARWLDPPRAAALALAAAFGTSLWSAASRAVWSHTWAVFLLAAALVHLARATREGGRLRPVLLGTLMSWMYFARPTMSLSIVAIGLWVLLQEPRRVPALAATGLAWLALFVAFAKSTSAGWLPPYYLQSGAFDPGRLPAGLAGLLVSPARGLLVYSPVLLVVAWLLVRHRPAGPERLPAAVGAGLVGAQILLLSAWPMWWGGLAFGPRMLTDLVPWFVLLGALGWRAARDRGRSFGRFGGAVAAILLAASVFQHGLAAWSRSPWAWSVTPDNVDQHPARLWDWSDAPFLRPFRSPAASGPGSM